ncbi:hypothetical protein [Pontibacter pudoricolor]|uniref:hypothetical protein n=1 Tax=Pontibacter pudoricolor TaxID=2694930 RepID=UPI001390BA01|nr:hypothetical protein [Pontibacter pudoricolor]
MQLNLYAINAIPISYNYKNTPKNRQKQRFPQFRTAWLKTELLAIHPEGQILPDQYHGKVPRIACTQSSKMCSRNKCGKKR